MYERDISDTQIIIQRLNTLIDLTQEIVDNLEMILQNQNQAYLISGIKKMKCAIKYEFYTLEMRLYSNRK